MIDSEIHAPNWSTIAYSLQEILSCPSQEQGDACEKACDDGFNECVLNNCGGDFTNNSCNRDCTNSMNACKKKCPCHNGGDCQQGCPCPRFQCEPVCEESVDYERSQVIHQSRQSGRSHLFIIQECTKWCFYRANETYIDCLSDFSPAFVMNLIKYEPIDVIPYVNCEKIAKDFSLECQIGCPCNQNCSTCSQMADTCNADFCPVGLES